MDHKLQHFGYASNHNNSLNPFGYSSKTFQVESQHHADTTLKLYLPGCEHVPVSKLDNIRDIYLDDESNLGLKLSPFASSSVCKDGSASTMALVKEPEKKSSREYGLSLNLYRGDENPVFSHTITKFDLELSLTTGSYKEIPSSAFTLVKCQNSSDNPPKSNKMTAQGEKPTHSGLFGPALSTSPAQCSLSQISDTSDSTILDSLTRTSNGSVTCTSGSKSSSQFTRPRRSSNIKNCQYEGCLKGARGASGLCIAHGGGRRCQRPGCNKGAEGRTVFCKAHGGGRRCHSLGCTKSAEGRTDYCIAHGGGRRCSSDGCSRAARGKSGLCIRHGGGKRCQREDCTRSAEGLSGFCISHGGGRRCQYPTCLKGAQGSTMFCKAHGGGKRCSVPGCTKGAEGSTSFCKGHGGGKRCSADGCTKSVHGGTLFCVAHGGGKRCSFPECTKSARGRTNFCVRHGGGKRCIQEGCGKSAQGSTDFCKAHGGKRSSLRDQPQFTAYKQAPCEQLAGRKSGLGSTHIGLVQDKRVHGGVTILDGLPRVKPYQELKKNARLDIMKAENMMNGDSLVSNKLSSAIDLGMPKGLAGLDLNSGFVSEGRVHGGSLLARLVVGIVDETKQENTHHASEMTRRI